MATQAWATPLALTGLPVILANRNSNTRNNNTLNTLDEENVR